MASRDLDHRFVPLTVMTVVAVASWVVFWNGAGGRSFGQDGTPGEGVVQSDAAAHHWPLRIDTPDGLITVYQPQLISFEGDRLSGRAAVSVRRPGQAEPVFGAIWIDSRVAVDRVARIVQILDRTVTDARFPESDGVTQQALTTALRKNLAQQSMTLSLDHLLAMVDALRKQELAENLTSDPPHVVFRTHPAMLVQYDGPPKLMQSAAPGLLQVVNTPFFVVLDSSSKSYYLKGAGRWFRAPDPTGPFQDAKIVPPAVAGLAESSGYKDPQQPLPAELVAGLEIITATEPTELIWMDGPEELATIPNTDLLYVSNTDADVFLRIQTQEVFVLLSGRWYKSIGTGGPWSFVPPDQLPQDFQRIPPSGPKGDVLAHVSGTTAARDAVADTYVPQTAMIDRKHFEPPTVQYDGEPLFEPLENSGVSYAVNTPNAVMLVGGRYYCCFNAVWYLAARPIGPWEICVAVPREIYTIPPTCPVYSVRYVYVYDATPDWAYVGYLPGYLGCYAYRGVVVYGTGYHYRPWVRSMYYPRPCTFGFAARYDAYSGHWGFDIAFSIGGGSVWIGDLDRSHRRGGEWFGYGGYRPVYERRESFMHRPAYPERIPVSRRDLNVYERRSDIHPYPNRPEQRRPVEFERPRIITPREPRPPVRARPSEPRSPTPRNEPVGREETRDNLFVNPRGEVYRKTLDGWEMRKDNRWVKYPATDTQGPDREDRAIPRERTVPDTKPEPTDKITPQERASRDQNRSELDREFRARAAGDQRARDGDRVHHDSRPQTRSDEGRKGR